MIRNTNLPTITGTLLTLLLTIGCAWAGPNLERGPIAEEIETFLTKNMSRKWYPRVMDRKHGGYLSNFNHRWEQKEGKQKKMIVTQARHVWTASRLAGFLEDRDTYVPVAEHGVVFLKDKMWDEKHGGFYRMVDRKGNVLPTKGDRIIKRAYGMSFAVYALARYYMVTEDEDALRLAKKTFRWLEEHHHDPEHKGYFQFTNRDGTPLKEGFGNTPPKDQNSSIHLLEAFTELYRVWENDLVRKRLREMLRLIRDTMVHPRGYLRLFFKRDWTPVSYRDAPEKVRKKNYYYDHVSFGHDVETAFLLLEASHVLGIEDDQKTRRTARTMVNHALRNGWDEETGGFYDRGYYFTEGGDITIIKDTKAWWAQAEGLHSLLMMSDVFSDADVNYEKRFREQWAYIQEYLLDHEHGGWFGSGLDKEPGAKEGPKSHIWKGAYHTTRSLIRCIRRLRGKGVDLR